MQSCGNESFDLDQLECPNNKIIEISNAPDTLDANGISVDSMTVKVCDKLLLKNKKVILTINGGKFIVYGEGKDSITVEIAETTYEAKFQVGTIPGDYRIKAEIKDEPKYFDEVFFKLEPIDFSSLIKITADTTDVYPNGNDKFLVSFVAPDFANNTFVLKTSSGKIVGSDNGVYNGKLDKFGYAFVSVQTEIFQSFYNLHFNIPSLDINIVHPVNLIKINSEDVHNTYISDTSGILADNLSTFTITSKIKYFNTNDLKVTYEVTNGTIYNSSASQIEVPVRSGEAKIMIMTTTNPNDILVESTLSSPKIQNLNIIRPGISYPEGITAFPNVWKADSSNFKINFSVTLSKFVGKSSNDRVVTMQAYQMISGNKMSIGRFRNNPLYINSEQKGDVEFSASAPDTDQPVIVVFSTLNVNREIISDTVRLDVVKK